MESLNLHDSHAVQAALVREFTPHIADAIRGAYEASVPEMSGGQLLVVSVALHSEEAMALVVEQRVNRLITIWMLNLTIAAHYNDNVMPQLNEMMLLKDSPSWKRRFETAVSSVQERLTVAQVRRAFAAWRASLPAGSVLPETAALAFAAMGITLSTA